MIVEIGMAGTAVFEVDVDEWPDDEDEIYLGLSSIASSEARVYPVDGLMVWTRAIMDEKARRRGRP